jgi:hypothetical protein
MRLDWALFISLIGWTKRVAVRAVRAVAVIGVDWNANGGGGVVSCVRTSQMECFRGNDPTKCNTKIVQTRNSEGNL